MPIHDYGAVDIHTFVHSSEPQQPNNNQTTTTTTTTTTLRSHFGSRLLDIAAAISVGLGVCDRHVSEDAHSFPG